MTRLEKLTKIGLNSEDSARVLIYSDQGVRWINQKEINLKGWDKGAKESLAVAVCNGAVYEPKLQTK